MSTAKCLALIMGLLCALALPGSPARADGAVTAQNLVSLGYSSGGRLHEEGLLLKAGGVVLAGVSDRREPVSHRQVSGKLKPAQVEQILRLVNAVNFPALKPQGGSPREVDGTCQDVGVTYRDQAGRQQHYYRWTRWDGPRPLAELCSYLGDITREELRTAAAPHKARRRHRPS